MAKRTQEPAEIPPSFSKEQGLQALSVMKDKGQKLLASRPIQEAAFDTWVNSTIDYIEKIYGSRIGRGHISNFVGGPHVSFGNPGEQYFENRRAKDLTHGIAVLASLIEQIETEMTLESPPKPTATVSFDDIVWPQLHAKVTIASKTRFDAGHYADAVEAALKELNTVIKEMVKKKTGEEHDGASLMLKAFSPNPPTLITLDDLSTESGRNIQQGYMQIYAGTMTGIRNPKAHQNLVISKERAIHFLFLASLLFKTLDERC